MLILLTSGFSNSLNRPLYSNSNKRRPLNTRPNQYKVYSSSNKVISYFITNKRSLKSSDFIIINKPKEVEDSSIN